MVIHTCFMVLLIGAAAGGAADAVPMREQSLLIATDEVLADVEQLSVVLATRETRQVEQLIDTAKLKARIVARLGEAGIRHVENEMDPHPRLVVHVEGISVPGSERYVYRVQTALTRLVTFTNRRDRRFQGEVWQVRPVMAVTAQAQAGEAIESVALTQAGVFAEACKTARALSEKVGATGSEPLSTTQAVAQDLQAVAKYAFIASRSSAVFHRPDCRWAQNISSDNLVGYQSREEAVQAGKRPCKSCKP